MCERERGREREGLFICLIHLCALLLLLQEPTDAAALLWLAAKAHKRYGLGSSEAEALQELQHRGVAVAAVFKSKHRFFKVPEHSRSMRASEVFALLGLEVRAGLHSARIQCLLHTDQMCMAISNTRKCKQRLHKQATYFTVFQTRNTRSPTLTHQTEPQPIGRTVPEGGLRLLACLGSLFQPQACTHSLPAMVKVACLFPLGLASWSRLHPRCVCVCVCSCVPGCLPVLDTHTSHLKYANISHNTTACLPLTLS